MTGTGCSARLVNNARIQGASHDSAAARDPFARGRARDVQASRAYRQATLPGVAPVASPVFRQALRPLQGTGPGVQLRTRN